MPSTVHREIQRKLLAIGEALGYRSRRSFKKHAMGDAVWLDGRSKRYTGEMLPVAAFEILSFETKKEILDCIMTLQSISPALGVLVVLLWVGGTYNGLVRLRNHCREAWADIDTELKRRYDLIPNLVETCKGYMAHEREVLENVTKARAQAIEVKGGAAEQAKAENFLSQTLRSLFAVSENYRGDKAEAIGRAVIMR